ncbi:MBL fold metallo-hydrolase [Thalassotalea sp. LPB0316]|uniref:MBL fold metallo-hydrolase n=1 Tax=Thalassotalea sp. LPB0316 TaxID=2769490 RepID=UPI0018690762|nr:MBL fold metallo-hydrolase [Thalassotalea sp. LPB0316]QOL25339.1 MBL fold metallo-hydrolase [Thalassotalea sp. LPB0316]
MKLHLLDGYIQQIYLVEEAQQLMLLDGCCRADVDTVTNYITNTLKLPLASLKNVVVTHMHPDHAGAASELRKVTGCKLIGANVDGHWYQGIDGFFMYLTDMALARWVGKRIGKGKQKILYPRHLSFDIKLNDGDVIPGFEDWQVLFSQGHTDRDLSVMHLPTKQIYIADLLVAVKGNYIPPFPIFYPNRYRNSIARLAQLDVNHVLLAHGGKQPKSALDFNLIEELSPSVPQTHWRSVKNKLFKSLS